MSFNTFKHQSARFNYHYRYTSKTPAISNHQFCRSQKGYTKRTRIRKRYILIKRPAIYSYFSMKAMKDIGIENIVSTATRAVCQLVNKGKTAATSVCLKKSGAGIFRNKSQDSSAAHTHSKSARKANWVFSITQVYVGLCPLEKHIS